ncbi:MAG: hypothetical protein ACOCXA_05345, partial [Planctomycetota bacterium]
RSIRFYRSIHQRMRNLNNNTLTVHTRPLGPLEYRILLNHHLCQRILAEDQAGIRAALQACEAAVQHDILEDNLLPIAYLSARGEREQARAFMRAMLPNYTDDILPEWQAYLQQLEAGISPAYPDSNAYLSYTHIVQAVTADMLGQRDEAERWYRGFEPSDDSYWLDFIAWRLQQP